ncbi:hypothetical protein F5Y16DRAFT_323229 [Xylariaceae sp. FL0255]|nr:hypothetical protein F5Y16DRAFT_323229 [Xylariaceae sp. FL0255]
MLERICLKLRVTLACIAMPAFPCDLRTSEADNSGRQEPLLKSPRPSETRMFLTGSDMTDAVREISTNIDWKVISFLSKSRGNSSSDPFRGIRTRKKNYKRATSSFLSIMFIQSEVIKAALVSGV